MCVNKHNLNLKTLDKNNFASGMFLDLQKAFAAVTTKSYMKIRLILIMVFEKSHKISSKTT